MSINEKVLNFMSKELRLNPKEDRYLLAVSGGIDSMAMLHVFHQLNLNFEVAHCNFQLRGKESDKDGEFVISQCEKIQVKCHLKSFETAAFADENGVGIQQAARDLRYEYFNQLIQENNLSWIATAHHLDDSIETFFINILRGTGIKGLSGIPPMNNSVIRPFSELRRQEIVEFIEKHKLPFREDSSNSSNYYLRNSIRNILLPEIEKIRTNVDSVVINEMHHFKELSIYTEANVKRHLKELLQENKKKNYTEVAISELTRVEGNKYLLFAWLTPFGFNSSDINDIYLGLQKSTKASYFSESHELIRDHGKLLLRVQSKRTLEYSGTINENTQSIDLPLKLTVSIMEISQAEINDNPKEALFDLDLLKYPLVVRKWRFGDYFYPLGMQNRKKLSDFFTDLKLASPVKDETHVLVSSNKVVWVIGHRIDNRFKLREDTERVVKFRLENN